jgi:hypothetical protein
MMLMVRSKFYWSRRAGRSAGSFPRGMYGGEWDHILLQQRRHSKKAALLVAHRSILSQPMSVKRKAATTASYFACRSTRWKLRRRRQSGRKCISANASGWTLVQPSQSFMAQAPAMRLRHSTEHSTLGAIRVSKLSNLCLANITDWRLEEAQLCVVNGKNGSIVTVFIRPYILILKRQALSGTRSHRALVGTRASARCRRWYRRSV